MAELNVVMMIGRLTRDPELRATPGGKPVATLSLALNRRYKTRDGESREEATFVDVTTWDRLAENCAKFLRRGSTAHVTGRLKQQSWSDKATGEKRSKLTIEAEDVQFLDRPAGDSGGSPAPREQGRWGGGTQPAKPARLPSADPGLPPARGYRPPPEQGLDADDPPF